MTGETNFEYRDWGNDIPVDILVLILTNLKLMEDFQRFGDFQRFRAVCQHWRIATACYKDQAQDRALRYTPWLVAKKRSGSGFMVHFPLAEFPFSIRVDINEMMRGASILCSKDGWLLVNKGAYKVFFFSFFSKSIIKLPNLPKAGTKFSGFTFTSSPTLKDCLVFGVSPHSYSTRLYLGASVSVGDENWTWKSFKCSERPYTHPNSGNPVYHQGKFGCVWNEGRLAVFPSELDSSCAFLTPTKVVAKGTQKNYLLEVDGELFAVFMSSMCRKVCVCKWDDSNLIWHKVNDIGEYMFCVSDRTTYAKKATALHMRNKLYFPYLEGKNGVFYCLKNEKLQSFQGFSGTDIYNTAIVLESCWMDPTQHSTPEWIKKSANCFVLSMNDDEDDEVDDTTKADTHDEEYEEDREHGLYIDFIL